MKKTIAVLTSTEEKYRLIAPILRDDMLKEPIKIKKLPGYRFEDATHVIMRARRLTDVQGLRCYQLIKYDDFMNANDAEQICLHWERDNLLYKKEKANTRRRRRRATWWQRFKAFIKGLFT